MQRGLTVGQKEKPLKPKPGRGHMQANHRRTVSQTVFTPRSTDQKEHLPEGVRSDIMRERLKAG